MILARFIAGTEIGGGFSSSYNEMLVLFTPFRNIYFLPFPHDRSPLPKAPLASRPLAFSGKRKLKN
jgi:hypothetical protein